MGQVDMAGTIKDRWKTHKLPLLQLRKKYGLGFKMLEKHCSTREVKRWASETAPVSLYSNSCGPTCNLKGTAESNPTFGSTAVLVHSLNAPPRISTLDQQDIDFDEMLGQEDAEEIRPMDGPPEEHCWSLDGSSVFQTNDSGKD